MEKRHRLNLNLVSLVDENVRFFVDYSFSPTNASFASRERQYFQLERNTNTRSVYNPRNILYTGEITIKFHHILFINRRGRSENPRTIANNWKVLQSERRGCNNDKGERGWRGAKNILTSVERREGRADRTRALGTFWLGASRRDWRTPFCLCLGHRWASLSTNDEASLLVSRRDRGTFTLDRLPSS